MAEASEVVDAVEIAQKQIDDLDVELRSKKPLEQIAVLRAKLLETTTSMAEVTREKEAQEASQQERNLLFISEIEKMQQFAMEGMTKVTPDMLLS